jgi:hypothetical protein
MKSNYNIDWKFIKELEGFSDVGYVPKDEANDRTPSGVTIGSGFDIGQLNLLGLKLMNFPKDLHKKLEPYVDKKGLEAKEFLKANPLKLTSNELDELEAVVKGYFTESIANEYDTHSKYIFAKLEKSLQTVIASVGYQYGTLSRRCPKFFKASTDKDVQKMIYELEHFGDAYKVRRQKEANYLRKELKIS